MAISDAERRELGEQIRNRREVAFGTKKAAYQEAGVNAATWDKAEAGETIRGDRLRSIVRALWPETEGDWTAIGRRAITRPEDVDQLTIERLAARVADLEHLIADLTREASHERKDEKSPSSGESA